MDWRTPPSRDRACLLAQLNLSSGDSDANAVRLRRTLHSLVQPRSARSAPFYVFTERPGLPLVPGGIGHGGGAHAPDAYLVIEVRPGAPIAGLAAMAMASADLLFAFAQA